MEMKEARYYEKEGEGVKCLLCPHGCHIREGNAGICRVRRNLKGRLIAESYGRLSSIHFDPVEKKPLYHFFPGRTILSIGSAGCNMRCRCCQNYGISQSPVGGLGMAKAHEATDIIRMARGDADNIGIAYTYNEPVISIEFMTDVARLAHAEGLKNVIVSNGYVNPSPMEEILSLADAFNIDLKGFSEDVYTAFAGARLEPVLQTLRKIRQSGRHLEITCLVVPSVNDGEESFAEMAEWIAAELGRETILHLSRYYPAFRMAVPSTPPQTLERLYRLASQKLDYVYVGNINMGNYQDTRCKSCGRTLIRRSGYRVSMEGLNPDGSCTACANAVVTMN